MAIKIADLQYMSKQASVRAQSMSLQESFWSRPSAKKAFLCHSHKDHEIALALQAVLLQAKIEIYIDWQDETLPSIPDNVTAQKIKDQIKQRSLFLFLATENSCSSRWCPWEIGYADGVKGSDNIIIIPTEDTKGTHHGNEYLRLYKRIDHVNGTLQTAQPKP